MMSLAGSEMMAPPAEQPFSEQALKVAHVASRGCFETESECKCFWTFGGIAVMRA